MNLFNIPSWVPFLDALATGLLADSGGDPLALAAQTVLLPTRRATRALREAFLRVSDGAAMLLPRLVPVGDLDAEEFAFLTEGDERGAAGLELPPAVPELRRLLLLTRLVQRWGEARGSGPLTPGQAAPLARELARFLDEVQAEGGDLTALGGLVPAAHAEHWQQVLGFLGILSGHWPTILAELGCIDPADRRNRVLAAQAEAWRRNPPTQPVVAAGVTGGIAAVADLLAVVATLPQGALVLAGIDIVGAEASWSAILDDPTHPQHLSARLLQRLGAAPGDVRPWRTARARDRMAARRRLVAEALRPAAESDRWRAVSGIDAAALDGLARLDCPGPQEEAAAIALLLRERMEHPGATAALVTPDRELARRVAVELGRWGIEIDDSAGIPLNRTPPGVFLRLVLELARDKLAPLPLLAALKHPLAAGGRSPESFRALVRRLELEALRGPRPAPGFAGLRALLAAEETTLADFVGALDAALAPLLAALAEPAVPLATVVRAHIAAAEALAASAEEDGAARLWREAAGETAAQFLAELLAGADALDTIAGAGYPALFEALLAGPVVRPRYGAHPRLAIWGLLEARLQHADLLILGGLNEGVWPPQTESEPWLSRPMRRAFGLPPPEQRIGAAADDFAQALGAPEVVLTRATRVEGAPTVPSRWLLRLETVLRAAGLDGRLGAPPHLDPVRWQALLDQPAGRTVIAPPAPRPPVSSRPRRLSVTAVETWMRDPYAIYAREILRLEALDAIDADPGVAERGSFIHNALDAFTRAYPATLPADAEARLLACGIEAFGTALERPGVRAFWWPRFERIARWFVAVETERRHGLAEIHGEHAGRLVLAGPAGGFELVARADRIDRRREGGLVLIDYKTGGVPLPGDVALGFSPQLPLEAAIAEAGGFAAIAAAAVTELSYWKLSGGNPPGERIEPADDADGLRRMIDEARRGLAGLIARFDDAATPYRAVPWAEKAPRYSDYFHLARVKEWLAASDGPE